MKIWLSKNSEIPVREQIVTQITLGIASGDLPTGTRLPSTREIALRYKVHSNTVSNAYQILAEQGWLEFRKGSGFYVRETAPESGAQSLDALILQFLQTALSRGFSLAEVQTRLDNFFKQQNSKKLIVVEDDHGLREILIEEISSALGEIEVAGASFAEFCAREAEKDAVFAAMFDEKAKISPRLSHDRSCVFLQARSAASSMTGERRPTSEDLIAVVSGWDNFLSMAKTLLVAARLDPESILLRSTKDKDWRKGLDAASMIICDSLTAKRLSATRQARVFRLIADDSLDEVKKSLGAVDA